MRMRKRHNLGPRMEKCAALLIAEPEENRGRWREALPGFDKLYVELGCGKGRFTAGTAEAMPDTLLLAIERVPDAMIIAMERVQAQGLENVRFMDIDAARLPELFAPGEIDRIYINFCDPWPKSRDAKLRLTAPGFLRLYADALGEGGQIHFKTDNTPLFDWSAEQLEAEGWVLSEVTHDLHGRGATGVMTDYEAKFAAEGMKINRLVAAKTSATLGTAAGPLPRLRGASLADARGYEKSAEDALRLEEATLPLCHAFYRDFEQAPELFEDPAAMTAYVYEPGRVDAFFAERQKRPDRRTYYILHGERVIGELVYKKLDAENKCCELGLCLVNDRVKNRGLGTAALRLALRHGFGALGMERIGADALLRNTRSQHVMQKAGFRYVSEDAHFKYYQITREQFLGQGRGESR